MIERQQLTEYLHSFLVCDQFQDYAPNGLQIEGKNRIERICTAVSATADSIEQAIHAKADALLVHHGFFWRGESLPLTGIKKKRIAALFDHGINLLAYHLPLDCHPQVGNNALLCQLLALKHIKTLRAGNTNDLLAVGSLTESLTGDQLCSRLQQTLQQKPVHIAFDKPITRVALCSGAAQDFIEEAYLAGADAYISGEISERTYYQAKELGIHYFACGHHATERFGIQALGAHLQQQFGLSHQFIDSDNPV